MFKKGLSILLAFFFLMSSSHLSFATHFCGGHTFKHALIINTADFGCGMEDNAAVSCKNQPQLTDKNCCDTQLIQYSLKDNFQASFSDVNQLQSHFVLLNFATTFFSFSKNETKLKTFKTHKIPLPKKDIPVLFQSFLI